MRGVLAGFSAAGLVATNLTLAAKPQVAHNVWLNAKS